jgi:hypothetical protein
MGSSCPVKIYFTSKLKNCFVNISPLLAKDWSNIWKVSEYLLYSYQVKLFVGYLLEGKLIWVPRLACFVICPRVVGLYP